MEYISVTTIDKMESVNRRKSNVQKYLDIKQPHNQRRNHKKIRKHFEMTDNENIKYQNLWGYCKGYKGKFIAINNI